MNSKFELITSKELYKKEYPPKIFIVKNMLTEGLNVIAGQPKSGKSWLVLNLCLSVSKGELFFGFETLKSPVLYLCLEGGERRLSERLKTITDEPTKDLIFSTKSESINNGLQNQIEKFLKDYKNTKLIVIDTWQKIREENQYGNTYQTDYNEVNQLRNLVEKYNICILLVHHTRKMHDDDPFNMITGSTGFTGALDNLFVLIKKERLSKDAKLHITGRDIDDKVFNIQFMKDLCIWDLVSIEDDKSVNMPEDLFFIKVLELLEKQNKFIGTATELSEQLKKVLGYEVAQNIITKKLNKYKDFLSEKEISYIYRRTGSERKIKLEKFIE